jgi:release factor glutamine methyltransferase
MEMTNNLGQWIDRSINLLKGKTDFPLVEVSAIAAHILDKKKEWLFAHPETEVSDDQAACLETAVSQLISGTPLPYITGRCYFYGLEFKVTPDVLIPRPETEELVEKAIQWLEQHAGRQRVIDVGTGSGAIAIALADHFPGLEIIATDISPLALKIAAENATLNHVEKQITFVESDLLQKVTEKVDLLLSNLPYIPTQDLLNLPVAKFEPQIALDGGTNGLSLISRLIQDSIKFLSFGGCIILEFQYNHTNEVIEIARMNYPQAQITGYKDLAGIPRGVIIQN